MRKIFLLSLLCLLAVTGRAQGDHNLQVAKNLEIFNAIYKNLDLMYVDTLNADEVVGNGIRAMLNSLDPYTEYYDESDVKKLCPRGRYLQGTGQGSGHQLEKTGKIQRARQARRAEEGRHHPIH